MMRRRRRRRRREREECGVAGQERGREIFVIVWWGISG